MADADGDVEADSVARAVNFPSDHGFDVGLRHNYTLPNKLPGSFNDFTVWHGTGIANGGDGGISKTWLTYAAPDTLAMNFRGSYSLAVVNHLVMKFSNRYTLNGYLVFTHSKGAAESNHLAKTFFWQGGVQQKIRFYGWGPQYPLSLRLFPSVY